MGLLRQFFAASSAMVLLSGCATVKSYVGGAKKPTPEPLSRVISQISVDVFKNSASGCTFNVDSSGPQFSCDPVVHTTQKGCQTEAVVYDPDGNGGKGALVIDKKIKYGKYCPDKPEADSHDGPSQ